MRIYFVIWLENKMQTLKSAKQKIVAKKGDLLTLTANLFGKVIFAAEAFFCVYVC